MMKQISLLCASAALLFVAQGHAANSTLNLRSDSKTITNKARSIEKEYSRDMRNSATNEHQGALVIDEGNSSMSMDDMPAVEEVNYYSAPMASSFQYETNLKMREDRRAGAGMMVGGATGLVGAMLELNFEDQDGVIAAFGTGPGYNTIQLGWKHSFEGYYLTPYTTASYSRWYNSRGRTTDYSESSILDRVLTDAEKKEGQFGTDFVNGSLGLQYNQLSGDFAGFSVFGELTAMYEVKRTMLLPTGSIGALYYF